MVLIPLAVVWAGYAVIWYGWAMIRGPGIGLADLVTPARSGKVDGWLSSPIGAGAGGDPSAPVPAPGGTGAVQPGVLPLVPTKPDYDSTYKGAV